MSKQLLFIKFPIIFPIIYGSILFVFPQYETELVLITILLLAETHFGATWPFFLSKANIDHIKNDKAFLDQLPGTAELTFALMLSLLRKKSLMIQIFSCFSMRTELVLCRKFSQIRMSKVKKAMLEMQ